MSYDPQTSASALVPPPHSIDLEQAVLGGILTNNDAFELVCNVLRAEHFAEPLHEKIYSIMEVLRRDGKPISIWSIKPFIEDMDLGPELTVNQYIARLATAAITIIDMPDYAKMLAEFYGRRQVIGVCDQIAREAATAMPDRTCDQIAADGAQRLQLAIDGATTVENRKTIGAAAAEMLARARLLKEDPTRAEVIPTGLTDLDRMTGGFEAGCLWVIGARPGMGKTALMASVANAVGRASVRRERDGAEGFGVLEFSLEVPQEQMTARHVADLARSSRSPIQFGRIMRGDLDDEEFWRVEEAARRLDEMPVILDCSSKLTLGEIAARVRIEKAKFARQNVRLRLVIIDYLKFIKASDRYKGNRVYEVGEISVGLKQIAKDEGLCVALLCQLNRALEGRDDKRPQLSDLRESGDLEADADVVAFLHREAYYIEKGHKFRAGDADEMARHADLVNQAEIIIQKNRAGPCRTVTVFCDIGCSSISNLAGA